VRHRLADIATVSRGTTLTRAETRPGTVPVVAGGLEPSCYHDSFNRDAPCITVSASGANAGYVALWEVPIFASDCSTIQVIDKDTVVLRFIYYQLKYLEGSAIHKMRQGAAQPHVYARSLAELMVIVPPLAEQKRVVAILDAAFEGIAKATENARQNLTKTQDLSQNILSRIIIEEQSLLPGRRLMDVCRQFGRGKSRHRPRNDPQLYGGKYPFIQTGDLSGNTTTVESFSQSVFEKLSPVIRCA